LWAWEDLNLRPHPYQQSRAERHADQRFPRSLASVKGEVIRCYSLAEPAHGRDAVAAGKIGQQPVAGQGVGAAGGRGSPIAWRDRDPDQATGPTRVLRPERLTAYTVSAPPDTTKAAARNPSEAMRHPCGPSGPVDRVGTSPRQPQPLVGFLDQASAVASRALSGRAPGCQ
jgi:hypothetical protein